VTCSDQCKEENRAQKERARRKRRRKTRQDSSCNERNDEEIIMTEGNLSPGFGQQNEHMNLIESRTNPHKILEKVRSYLEGTREVVVYTSGSPKWETVQSGKPKANADGVNFIMQELDLRINPHTIMGNFTEEEYQDHICSARKELTSALVVLCYEFGIDDMMLRPMVDAIMGLVEPVMSRLKYDRERTGLNQIGTARYIYNNKGDSGGTGEGS